MDGRGLHPVSLEWVAFAISLSCGFGLAAKRKWNDIGLFLAFLLVAETRRHDYYVHLYLYLWLWLGDVS